MAPPSQSFRSSTLTRRPARASKAAQASELIPLPTMTTSTSAIGEPAELVVRHESALARAELLHLCEEVRARVVGEVEAELVGLDPDRVEPALLAEHDAALGGDEGGRIRPDRRWIVELRCNRARFAAEERLARDRLPRLERVTREQLHARRYLADAIEAEVRIDAVERPKGECDFAEVRVAGALAHTVDRPLNPGCAGAHGRDGGGGREPEVVVAVEVHRHVGTHPLDGLAHEIRNRLGGGDPERVDDDHLARAGFDRRLVHAL